MSYVTSIFFQAMFSDLGWSRGDLALSMSVGAILAAFAGPFIGDFVDKYGASRIMAISAFATGVCLMSVGYVHELWQAFVAFSLLAVFRAGFVSIPVMVMVSNWFTKKRGRAMGIATAGQGLGGFILSPLSVYLISSIGWRLSWGVMGLLTWVVMIPSALLLAKQNPAVMGLSVDGDSSESGNISTGESAVDNKASGKALKDIVKMPAFWGIAILHSLYLFGHLSIFQHGYSLFTDQGIPAITVGTMIGVLGLFSLAGKIALGYVSDRISIKCVTIIALVLGAAAVAPLFMEEKMWGGWLFIVFWGFWECGVVALLPILVASYFDRSIVGKMLGIFSIFSVIPQLAGPAFTGYIFDITGSYHMALFSFIGCYIISAALIFFTRPSK
ncbi:MAG: MFS transporter [Dehalococcoidales bacterium]|nr:MFS transporter [Dehalococcoidales bacterium]